MVFCVDKHDGFSVVAFDFPGGVLTPNLLATCAPPQVALDQGIVLSGRGPIWLFCYLAHHFHPAKWVATHDPRLGGAVVVQAHTPDVFVGQVVPLPQ
ncbi:MAG: CRISPR-associated ring nuclease Crn3/Csx3 [Gloeomargarita sp. SKYG98]|nr:CRISPR-associated ring nuclease Crn3/Csx3 [Gloeomargarita sp. SKYG98]